MGMNDGIPRIGNGEGARIKGFFAARCLRGLEEVEGRRSDCFLGRGVDGTAAVHRICSSFSVGVSLSLSRIAFEYRHIGIEFGSGGSRCASRAAGARYLSPCGMLGCHMVIPEHPSASNRKYIRQRRQVWCRGLLVMGRSSSLYPFFLPQPHSYQTCCRSLRVVFDGFRPGLGRLPHDENARTHRTPIR